MVAAARLQAFWEEARAIVVEEWMGKPIDAVGEAELKAATRAKERAVEDYSRLSEVGRYRLEARLAEVLMNAEKGVADWRIAVEKDRVGQAQHKLVQKDMELARQRGRVEAMEQTVRLLATNGSAGGSISDLSAVPVKTPPSPALPPNAKSEEALRPWTEFKVAFMDYQKPGASAQDSYALSFRRLEAVIGQKAIGSITMEDIQEYRSAVAAASKPRAGRKAPSAANLQKALSNIKTFFSWAAGDGRVIRESPAANVFLTPGMRQEGKAIKKLPYSKEELARIFDAPLFTGCLSRARRLQPGVQLVRDGKFWLPLLALFTGGRLKELSTLAVQDIVFAEGHHCISINVIPDDEDDEDEDPTQKTDASIRIVPIHPELRKLGFLKYVEVRRKRGVRLFEDVDFGKFWNQQFLPSIGLKRPDLTFHSFRHTYKRALRALQSDETTNRLMGHAPARIGEVYGGGIDEAEARWFCEGFRLPVDLTHLYAAVPDGR